MLIGMLLGIACAGATLYAQGNTYRVVSSYGELAVITFPNNDTRVRGRRYKVQTLGTDHAAAPAFIGLPDLQRQAI